MYSSNKENISRPDWVTRRGYKVHYNSPLLQLKDSSERGRTLLPNKRDPQIRKSQSVSADRARKPPSGYRSYSPAVSGPVRAHHYTGVVYNRDHSPHIARDRITRSLSNAASSNKGNSNVVISPRIPQPYRTSFSAVTSPRKIIPSVHGKPVNHTDISTQNHLPTQSSRRKSRLSAEDSNDSVHLLSTNSRNDEDISSQEQFTESNHSSDHLNEGKLVLGSGFDNRLVSYLL